MKLNSEFYRLPLTFDVDRLTAEVNAFSDADWMPHPTGYAGNTSIPLISVNGEVNDEFIGKMRLTPQLEKCPYIKQVIASFDEVFGRSRLMRLAGNSEVPEHTDLNYHWYNRVRIHIPIITYPDVTFYCGDAKVHMQAGEAWIFDSWRMHKVINSNVNPRTHLVIDTSGSSKFWDMVDHSDQPHKDIFQGTVTKKHVAYTENKECSIQTEQYNASTVMSPGELDALCIDIISDVAASNDIRGDIIRIFERTVNDFRYDWRRTWSLYGSSEEGWPYFRRLVSSALDKALKLTGIPLSSNEADAAQVFHGRVLAACFNPSVAQNTVATPQDNQRKVVSASRQVGQNSPCPCGSGKKYKRCCGKN